MNDFKTGPRSAVGNMSGNRCRSGDQEFDPSPVDPRNGRPCFNPQIPMYLSGNSRAVDAWLLYFIYTHSMP